MNMEWLQLIVSVLAGLATAIPLAIKLVEYVRKAVKEKNWPEVVSLVIELMSEVEGKMEVGADKKTYVLAVLKASADTIKPAFKCFNCHYSIIFYTTSLTCIISAYIFTDIVSKSSI